MVDVAVVHSKKFTNAAEREIGERLQELRLNPEAWSELKMNLKKYNDREKQKQSVTHLNFNNVLPPIINCPKNKGNQLVQLRRVTAKERQVEMERNRIYLIMKHAEKWKEERNKRLEYEELERKQKIGLILVQIACKTCTWIEKFKKLKLDKGDKAKSQENAAPQGWQGIWDRAGKLHTLQNDSQIFPGPNTQKAAIPMELRKSVYVHQDDMADKYNNAADIMRVFLKATCKCRAQLALQQYRRKIILCQRYWKSYKIITEARKKMLVLAWKKAARQIDYERFESYTLRLKSLYSYDCRDVESILDALRIVKTRAQYLIHRKIMGINSNSSLHNSNTTQRGYMNGCKSTCSNSTLAPSNSFATQGNLSSKLTQVYKFDQKISNGVELDEKKIMIEASLMSKRGIKHKIVPNSVRNSFIKDILIAARRCQNEKAYALLDKRLKARSVCGFVTKDDVKLSLLSGNNLTMAEARVQRINREVSAVPKENCNRPGAKYASPYVLMLSSPMLLLRLVSHDNLKKAVILAERQVACLDLEANRAKLNLKPPTQGCQHESYTESILNELKEIFRIHRRPNQSEESAFKELQMYIDEINQTENVLMASSANAKAIPCKDKVIPSFAQIMEEAKKIIITEISGGLL